MDWQKGGENATRQCLETLFAAMIGALRIPVNDFAK